MTPPGRRRAAPSATRLLIALLAGIALVSGCGPTAPTSPPATTAPATTAPATTPPATGAPPTTGAPSPTPGATADQAAIYATIERQVEAIRGLRPTRPVDPILLDPAALQETLAEASADDASPEELAKRGRLLIALGLLPEDADLAALTASFQTSQIAGFYVPTDGRLYVVSRSGALGAAERTTFAHEYTHALQDQHFPLLDELGVDKVPHGDRDLGQLALIEGDATVLMTYWAQEHLSVIELLQLLGASLDPGQLAVLNSMPPFLRDSALFPYESGLQFVMQLQVQGGWDAVNAAFSRPPESTEQVLHPERYEAREAPVVVQLPATMPAAMGAGWALDSEDTLGEFQLRSWLTDAMGSTPTAQQKAAASVAADGWGGDRVGLFRGPAGAWAAVMKTSWDTDGDAREFFKASETTLEGTGGFGSVVRVKNPKEIWVVLGSDAATVKQAETAAGIAN